jgi:outer membrane protein OmpA-like peptidoglycan-associated protein
VGFSQRSVAEYALATGSMKKINGVIAPEFLQYVSGRLTRITYQLPRGRNSLNAFNHFQRQFDNLPHEVLYRCDGRACGESNQWANVQFGIARLYGIDREQHYSALRLTLAGAEPAYLALYTIKRGNKRIYAQIDLIEPEPDPELQSQPSLRLSQGPESQRPESQGPESQLSQSLSSTALVTGLKNGARVYLLADQLADDAAAALRQLLQDQPELRLILVGHSDQAVSPGQKTTRAEQQALSLQLAQALQQRLQAQGIEASRLHVEGVGAMAPAYDNRVPDQRVELLLRAR